MADPDLTGPPVPPFSAAWQDVTCSDCGACFQCTPATDYYHRPDVAADQRTLENGVCERCLLTAAGIEPRNMIVLDPTRQS